MINEIATNHQVPPVLAPRRNCTPFLDKTAISALPASSSRGGERRLTRLGTTSVKWSGTFRTWRLLTDDEAAVAKERWVGRLR